MQSRARDDPHKKQPDHDLVVDPRINMDFFNLGLGHNLKFPALAILEGFCGNAGSTAIRAKGPDRFTVAITLEFLKYLGYPRFVLKTDGEPSMEALVDAISAKLSSDPKVIRVGREVSPVGSHQSNGAAEVAVQLIEGIARTFVLVVEEKYKCKVTVRSPILP